ncbi:MAG: PIN domain-containing protein [Pseudoxanthomonas sp.]
MSATHGHTVLLDGNVLVALFDARHVHHRIAEDWFSTLTAPFATCPITQGTLLRLLRVFNAVPDMPAAVQMLRALIEHPRHRFWPDDFDYLQVDWQGVLGHKQVTDAYLATLARKHGGKLATFDQGLAALHPDVVELLE